MAANVLNNSQPPRTPSPAPTLFSSLASSPRSNPESSSSSCYEDEGVVTFRTFLHRETQDIVELNAVRTAAVPSSACSRCQADQQTTGVQQWSSDNVEDVCSLCADTFLFRYKHQRNQGAHVRGSTNTNVFRHGTYRSSTAQSTRNPPPRGLGLHGSRAWSLHAADQPSSYIGPQSEWVKTSYIAPRPQSLSTKGKERPAKQTQHVELLGVGTGQLDKRTRQGSCRCDVVEVSNSTATESHHDIRVCGSLKPPSSGHYLTDRYRSESSGVTGFSEAKNRHRARAQFDDTVFAGIGSKFQGSDDTNPDGIRAAQHYARRTTTWPLFGSSPLGSSKIIPYQTRTRTWPQPISSDNIATSNQSVSGNSGHAGDAALAQASHAEGKTPLSSDTTESDGYSVSDPFVGSQSTVQGRGKPLLGLTYSHGNVRCHGSGDSPGFVNLRQLQLNSSTSGNLFSNGIGPPSGNQNDGSAGGNGNGSNPPSRFRERRSGSESERFDCPIRKANPRANDCDGKNGFKGYENASRVREHVLRSHGPRGDSTSRTDREQLPKDRWDQLNRTKLSRAASDKANWYTIHYIVLPDGCPPSDPYFRALPSQQTSMPATPSPSGSSVPPRSSGQSRSSGSSTNHLSPVQARTPALLSPFTEIENLFQTNLGSSLMPTESRSSMDGSNDSGLLEIHGFMAPGGENCLQHPGEPHTSDGGQAPMDGTSFSQSGQLQTGLGSGITEDVPPINQEHAGLPTSSSRYGTFQYNVLVNVDLLDAARNAMHEIHEVREALRDYARTRDMNTLHRLDVRLSIAYTGLDQAALSASAP